MNNPETDPKPENEIQLEAGGDCPSAPCSALQKCADRVSGHIAKPLDIYAIVSEIDSDEYNAELMLQHLLLWAAKTERNLKDPHCVRAMALLGEIILPNAKAQTPPDSCTNDHE